MSLTRDEYIQNWRHKLEDWKEAKPIIANTEKVIQHSGIKPVEPPIPPHINIPIRLSEADIDLNQIWKFLNKKSLFVLSWSFRGKGAKALIDESERLFDEWKRKVIDDHLFSPKVVYGYFRCHNRDNKLVIDSPAGDEVVFDFPRSTKNKYLCLTDYFGKDDIVAFQAVTVGSKTSDILEKWNAENLYTDAYFLHGLAVETAEALAEWVNNLIRKDLKLTFNRGLRYSWGYPSCPDISQHKLVWKILDPVKSGMTLTESGQIVPDQSTAAIVVHHPEAEYFLL
jgi:5-methyltetrahydrofolate--homocysteine methyltransferase